MRRILALVLLLASVSFAQSTPVNGSRSLPFSNDATIGTAQYKLAKLTASGSAVVLATGDTQGAIGICDTNCGTSGVSYIAFEGIQLCAFDGATTTNDTVTIGTAGGCHDLGSQAAPANQCIGRVLSTNASAGNYQIVFGCAVPAGSGGGSVLPNAPTLAKITEALGSPLWNGGVWPGGGSGLGDPGGNGLVKRTGVNLTVPAVAGTDYQAPLGFTPAADSTVMHNTGNETIHGTKTFDNVAVGTTLLGPQITETDQTTPSNPTSGTTSVYSKAGKLCSLSPAGVENCTGAAVSAPLGYGYYFYVSGSTVYARNNATGVVDYSGTDSAVVVNSAMAANSLVCGHLDFGPFTFPVNSWLSETVTGYTNRKYAFGVPGQPSTSQLCTWKVTASGPPSTVDQFGDPQQTTGTIFTVGSPAFSALSTSSVPVVWWARPSAGVNNISASVEFSDFDVRYPSNQINGNMEAIDCTAASNCTITNTQADTAIAQNSLAYPITPTVAGSAAFVSTASEHEENMFVKNISQGYYNGFNIQTDHLVWINNWATECAYAVNYGVTGAVPLNYPASFIAGGWAECSHGLTIGTNVLSGSLLTWDGLNWEDAIVGGLLPAFVPIYHGKELTAGNTYGRISYNPGVENNAGPQAAVNLFDGGGGANIDLCAVGYPCTKIASITGPAGAVVGPVTFTGSGVTQGGTGNKTFTFSGSGGAAPAGSSGDIQTNGGAGALGSIPQSTFVATSTGAQPTCALATRGYFWTVQGNGTTTGDATTQCQMNSSGTYAWVSLGSGGGSMVYPGAGISISTGSAWGTSLAVPSGFVFLDATSSIQTQLTTNAGNIATNTTAIAARVVYSTAAQPTCAVGTRGNKWIVQGNGTTTSDSEQTCILKNTGAYAWQVIF